MNCDANSRHVQIFKMAYLENRLTIFTQILTGILFSCVLSVLVKWEKSEGGWFRAWLIWDGMRLKYSSSPNARFLHVGSCIQSPTGEHYIFITGACSYGGYLKQPYYYFYSLNINQLIIISYLSHLNHIWKINSLTTSY